MKPVLLLAIVAGLASAATALAAQGGGNDPYTAPEPDVSSARVLRLAGSPPSCSATRRATVRVNPPFGAILGFVRGAVDGRPAVRRRLVTVLGPAVQELQHGGEHRRVRGVLADRAREPRERDRLLGIGA